MSSLGLDTLCPPTQLVSAPPFIYLQSFKLDFNDLKHEVGLLKKKIKSSLLCGTKLDFQEKAPLEITTHHK